jgi:hypothetical protein
LDSAAAAFVEDEFVEDGEDLLSVVVELPEVVAEVAFVLAAGLPFLEERRGDINVATEGVDGVASEEEAIEEGRFAAGGQRIVQILVERQQPRADLWKGAHETTTINSRRLRHQ